MSKKFKIFTLPTCGKCKIIKAYFKENNVEGEEVDLAEQEGLADFRKYYRDLKDKLPRDDSGSLPVPIVLFFAEDESISDVCFTLEEVKKVLGDE